MQGYGYSSRKLELIKLLAETENPSIIEAIKRVFQSEKKDWWGEFSDKHKVSIKEGERQIENGEFVTSEEMVFFFKIDY
jgi:predicted transcriptional regulator